MKHLIAAALLVATPAAWAHTPEHGEMSDHVEMVLDRSVTFMPMAGQLHVLKIVDGADAAQSPASGEVAVMMATDEAGGTQIAFNNGLDYAFDYALEVVADDGQRTALKTPGCAIGATATSTAKWPETYPKIVLSKFRKAEGPSCPAG